MHEELQAELIDDSSNRAACYELLSSLYLLELTSEQVERFRALDLSSLSESDETISEGLAEMARYFRLSEGRDVRQELASDYAHSILGVTADERRMALPYESVFTSANGLLMQDARDDVYRLFCQEHTGTVEGFDVPEDHLGLVFEFMARMCACYNEVLIAGDFHEALRLLHVQEEMLQNHLLNWIDVYCDTLEEVARTDFYRALGKVTRGWVHVDALTVESMIADTEDEVSLQRLAYA